MDDTGQALSGEGGLLVGGHRDVRTTPGRRLVVAVPLALDPSHQAVPTVGSHPLHTLGSVTVSSRGGDGVEVRPSDHAHHHDHRQREGDADLSFRAVKRTHRARLDHRTGASQSRPSALSATPRRRDPTVLTNSRTGRKLGPMRRGDGTGFAGLRSPFVWVVIVALVAGVVGLGALLVATSGGTRSGNGEGPFPSYAQPGPFAAGVTTVALSYGPVEVWYPVEHAATAGHARDSYDIRDWLPPDLASRVPKGLGSMGTDAYRDVAPSVHGPFPLVLFAHGLYSFRDQSTFLTSWLASWGFVVAAPEFTTHDLTEYFL